MSAIAFSGVKDSGKTISSKIYRYLYVKWLWDINSSFEKFIYNIDSIQCLNTLSFATINKIKDNPNNLFIIDDVRFKAEYEACLNNNIPVYKIINSKFTSKDKHVSETDLDSMIWDEDKIIVWNGEDLESLYNQIKNIFENESKRSY